MLLTPYKGSEPYIFISYAHRNSQQVMEIIRQLQDGGFRVWYDEGIDPGTEWDENIASHINQCFFFLALLSEEYLASKNCLDELSYAREKEKNRVLIYLENVELPEGLKMRLNRLQAIHWYQYRSYPERAFEKLCETPELDRCRAASAPSRTEAPPEPPAEPASNPPAWRKWAIAGGAGALAVLAALGLWLHSRTAPETVPAVSPAAAVEAAQPATEVPVPSETPEPAASEEPEVLAQPEDPMRRATLTAGPDMTVRGFLDGVELLRQRVELFTQGLDYELEVAADTVTLALPEAALPEKLQPENWDYLFWAYLCAKADFYFLDSTKAALLMPAGAYFQLDRSDLAQVELLEGTIPQVDASEYGVETETYPYILLTLTDEAAARYADSIAAWGANIALGQDITGSSWGYFKTFPMGDGKGFYVLNEDAPALTELLHYNMTHPGLTDSFRYELWAQPQWQRPGDDAGENQVAPEALTEDTVTLIYRTYREDMTAGEQLDMDTGIRARMDALGVPYCYGTTKTEGELALRVPADRYARKLMELVGDGSYSALSLSDGLSAWNASLDLSIQREDDGTWSVLVTPKSEGADPTAFCQAALARGGRVYLNVGGAPWFYTDLQAVPQDGTLRFDRLCFAGEDPLTGDNAQIADLLEVWWNGTKLPTTCYLERAQFSEGAEDLGLLQYDVSALLANIQAVVPEAKVRYGDRTVYVSLYLDVNETLPETGTALARAIYEAADLEHSLMEQITVYMIDEDDDTKERARIFFHRHEASNYSSSQELEVGTVYATGIFVNGRLDRYQEAFQTLVLGDEFWLTLAGSYPYGEGDPLAAWTFSLE